MAVGTFLIANSMYLLEVTPNVVQASVGTSDEEKNFDFNFETVSSGPYLNLKSAFLVDYDSGDVLYAKNNEATRSIASISKLVAAMVVIDADVNLNNIEKITKEDAYRSSKSRLKVGYEFTLYDLLHAGLMNSDNRAMRALARATFGSIEKFAEEMNKKARRLNLKKSIFYEPTGLDLRNVSTAEEVAKIVNHASDYSLIAGITAKKKYKVKVQNRKKLFLQMANTNLLVVSPYKVLTGKTGYIKAADYCLATLVKNNDGKKLTVVVLGVPGDKLRFRECRKLLDWGFQKLDNHDKQG